MGYWGVYYQESDGYLDLFDEMFDPIKKILTKDKYSDDAVIDAAGLLLDVLKNSELYYEPEKELVGVAIKKLNVIAKRYDARSWKRPAERIESIERLQVDLEELYAEETRSTTLGKL